MVDSKRVLLVGLTAEQIAEVTQQVIEPEYTFVKATSCMDVAEVNYFVAIINDDAISDSEMEAIARFLRTQDGQSTVKIVVSTQEDLWKKLTNAIVFSQFDAMKKRVADMLEKAYARAKRAENLANNMRISFMVLQLVQDKPGIKSDEIAKQIGRSEPAAKRYIEELRLAGQPIGYDTKLNGWVFHR